MFSPRIVWGLISVGAAAAVCFASPFVATAPADPPVAGKDDARKDDEQAKDQGKTPAPRPGPQPAFTGTNRCIICHRKQYKAYSETKHAKAFEILPVKYREDASCLKCHVTAFGEPTGFKTGQPIDAVKHLLDVGCEVCHGPGAVHEDAVKRWTNATTPEEEEKLLVEVKATTRKTPPDRVCAHCHQGQGHGAHPPYEGQRPKSVLAAHGPSVAGVAQPCGSCWPSMPSTPAVIACQPPSCYSVKTCGSCHYGQYKAWQTERHASLAARLPARYAGDRECLTCHPKGHSALLASADSPNAGNHIGAACESCHGPGREHIVFNRQFIAGPPLSPESEKAARQSIRKDKPVAACIQCHLREQHKEHPEFEKPKAVAAR